MQNQATTLQDALYSFNTVTSNIVQTRSQSFIYWIYHVLMLSLKWSFPEEALNLPPPADYQSTHSNSDASPTADCSHIYRFVKGALAEEKDRRKAFALFSLYLLLVTD